MQAKIFGLLLISFAGCLSGCAAISENITLNPSVNIQHISPVTNGKKIAVDVIDARPSGPIGGRATYVGSMANINLANDLSPSAEKIIINGLNQYGFNAVPYRGNIDNSLDTLKLSITMLTYKVIPHLFNLDLVLESQIIGEAKNHKKTYTAAYRKQKIYTVIVAPPSSTDKLYLNEVFSDVLKQVLTDKKLIKFLSE